MSNLGPYEIATSPQFQALVDQLVAERAHADRLAEALRKAKPAPRRALIGIIDDALAAHDKRRSEA